MDRKKELQEARDAADIVIEKIDRAMDSLDSAEFWGMWDIFGGDFFSSLKKRNKIEEANEYINDITDSVKVLDKELKDVDMVLPEEISNTMSDRTFDIWLDNIFTDLRVQDEIKEAMSELREFRNGIEDLVIRLDNEIEELEK
ncbi:hypothetical protein [Lagierella massiliensis]|uniref:hypothetical protein n=1 Tax=Lagierella massiliensis TaxID=1689303 RepID=UPI0006D765A8|nr:hypothetical protein [Lagierella massiliensis]